MAVVDIVRKKITVKLFDTEGAEVTLYSSPTIDEQTKILDKYGSQDTAESKAMIAYETICNCFVEWNIGKDGVVIPCSVEILKTLTQTDVLALLQACTGRKLLDEEGNILTDQEVSKKAVSA